MKRVVKTDSELVQLDDLLERLVSELEEAANKFCEDNDLNCDTWGQVNDFDTTYDKTVDVNFSVTVDIPDEEE